MKSSPFPPIPRDIAGKLSLHLRDEQWLKLPTPLIRELARATGSSISVTVLKQHYRQATPFEKRRLNSDRLWCREVALCANDAVLVTASTVTPSSGGAVPILRRLGRRPLNTLLWQPRLARRERHGSFSSSETSLQRSFCWWICDKPLMVSETLRWQAQH